MARSLAALALALGLWGGIAAAQEELVYQEGQWVPAVAPARGTPEGHLALIRQELEEGDPDDALDEAKDFLKQYPGHPLTERALYLAGESELADGDYWQAYEWYERVLDRYPTGELYERTLARETVVADAFLAGKWRRVWGIFFFPARAEGLDILGRVAERLPTSTLAEESLLKIGDYHYQREHWVEAAEAYEHYLEFFPDREASPEAELRSANAMYNSYGGPQFDDTALLEAEQRYQAFAARYPQAAAEADIADVQDVMTSEKARKDFEVARFYGRTGRPEAAAFYCRQVIALYPDTPFAARAQEMLEELGAPALPAVFSQAPPRADAPPAVVPEAPPRADGPGRAPAGGLEGRPSPIDDGSAWPR